MIKSVVDTMLEVFIHETNQAKTVISTIKPEYFGFTPKEGMRSLIELANHLVQIPSIDLKLFSGEFKDSEQTRKHETELNRFKVDELLKVYDDGIEEVKTYFYEMSDQDFFMFNIKPFYDKGSMKNWAYYLPESITHTAMHKMQLWMYLRLIGAEVNMMTYYGHPPI
jgi:uncharacterized damage-inducible protein DinB